MIGVTTPLGDINTPGLGGRFSHPPTSAGTVFADAPAIGTWKGSAASMFTDEVIAMTVPGGTLDQGEYDVVYDNCQDGTVDPEDAVWPDAISVTMPAGDLPPVSDSIRQIKEAARVLSRYVAAIGVRAFPEMKNYEDFPKNAKWIEAATQIVLS